MGITVKISHINQSLFCNQPIHWFSTQEVTVPNPIYNWLTELDSMTESFARYCQQVTVKLYQEGFILLDSQDEEAKLLPNSQRYWLREVVLLGDGCPWLYGWTVIPEETVTGPESELINLGSVPLGKYLFNGNNLIRDYINLGIQNNFLVRSSLLILSANILLLTELFLSDSPIYTK